MAEGTTLPQSQDLMWPTIEALRSLGGSGTTEEIHGEVVGLCEFNEEQQGLLHGQGRQSELEYRLAWARTYLKHIGAVSNSTRGVWALTEAGETMSDADVALRTKEWKSRVEDQRRLRRSARQSDPDELQSEADLDSEQEADDWKDQLIALLLSLSPAGFERLAQRLLREAGFVNVSVTGRSGDGGIDGVGVYRVSLVSFPTFFQCKRYRGSVGAGAVRDFRGAMAGRGEKGLLITTGTFTRDATMEANRAGATPIELFDGDRLCDLLKLYGLGVRVVERVVEDVDLDRTFFADLA